MDKQYVENVHFQIHTFGLFYDIYDIPRCRHNGLFNLCKYTFTYRLNRKKTDHYMYRSGFISEMKIQTGFIVFLTGVSRAKPLMDVRKYIIRNKREW